MRFKVLSGPATRGKNWGNRSQFASIVLELATIFLIIIRFFRPTFEINNQKLQERRIVRFVRRKHALADRPVAAGRGQGRTGPAIRHPRHPHAAAAGPKRAHHHHGRQDRTGRRPHGAGNNSHTLSPSSSLLLLLLLLSLKNFPWKPRAVNILTERYANKLHDYPAIVLFVGELSNLNLDK